MGKWPRLSSIVFFYVTTMAFIVNFAVTRINASLAFEWERQFVSSLWAWATRARLELIEECVNNLCEQRAGALLLISCMRRNLLEIYGLLGFKIKSRLRVPRRCIYKTCWALFCGFAFAFGLFDFGRIEGRKFHIEFWSLMSEEKFFKLVLEVGCFRRM